MLVRVGPVSRGQRAGDLFRIGDIHDYRALPPGRLGTETPSEALPIARQVNDEAIHRSLSMGVTRLVTA